MLESIKPIIEWCVSLVKQEWFWTFAAVISTVLIFAFQQVTQNKISRATFVYNISNDFANNDRILNVYQWLEHCRRKNAGVKSYSKLQLTSNKTIYDKESEDLKIDFIDIDTYINHFEAVYIILESVKMDSIDELFQQRFFSFMLNPFIQKEELFECFSSDKNDFLLFKKWLESIFKKKGYSNKALIEYLNTYTCGEFEFPQMTDTDVSPLKRIKNYFETRNFLLNYVYYICDPSCKYGYYAFKNRENERRVMRIIRPSPDDFADIMSLQDFVCQNLDNKDWYFSSTEEEIKTALNDKENYLCLQIVDHDRIVAFAYVIMNPDSKHSLSHDTKNHQLEKGECVFETVFVHPDYRGFGIQMLLLEVLSDWAQKQGGKSLWATVHPDNIYSAKNFQANGFHIASVEPIEKYASKRNYYKKVLCKNKRGKSGDYIIFPYI